MRFLDELNFDAELAQAVNITPQHIQDSAAHDQAFREQVVPQASIPHEGDVARKFKRLYIRQEDIVSFGHTPGCPRCEHSMRYGAGRTNIPHSDLCRQRIAAELRGSEVGRRRLAEHDRRTNQQIAGQIQQQHEVPQMDAPVAQGEIVRDGRAEASKSVVPSHFLIVPDAPSQRQLQRQAVIYVIDRYQKQNSLETIMIKKRRAAPCPPRGSR